jgi:hypothetical protein
LKAENKSTKIIHFCGWRYEGLESNLFPEFVPASLGKKTPSNSDSLLLLGIFGTCLSPKNLLTTNSQMDSQELERQGIGQ